MFSEACRRHELRAQVAGAIVVEDVFSYPGIGLATVDAINQRDYLRAGA